MRTKTIDVIAFEWFDNINGNSYFTANVTIDLGLPTEENFFLPFQYGYGDQFEYEARDILFKHSIITDKTHALSYYCREHNIILRSHKYENCKKSELLQMDQ